eukprot:jgi/Orpsp1_1/1185027/evm.model.c7180000092023.1
MILPNRMAKFIGFTENEIEELYKIHKIFNEEIYNKKEDNISEVELVHKYENREIELNLSNLKE